LDISSGCPNCSEVGISIDVNYNSLTDRGSGHPSAESIQGTSVDIDIDPLSNRASQSLQAGSVTTLIELEVCVLSDRTCCRLQPSPIATLVEGKVRLLNNWPRNSL